MLEHRSRFGRHTEITALGAKRVAVTGAWAGAGALPRIWAVRAPCVLRRSFGARPSHHFSHAGVGGFSPKQLWPWPIALYGAGGGLWSLSPNLFPGPVPKHGPKLGGTEVFQPGGLLGIHDWRIPMLSRKPGPIWLSVPPLVQIRLKVLKQELETIDEACTSMCFVLQTSFATHWPLGAGFRSLTLLDRAFRGCSAKCSSSSIGWAARTTSSMLHALPAFALLRASTT